MTKNLMGYAVVPVNCLVSMPFPSRFVVEDSDFDDLVESIRAVGVLEPIMTRPKAEGLFEIVMGERRVKAARKAGLREVPAIVRELADVEAVIYRSMENLHRKDLSDKEKSEMLVFLSTFTKLNPKELAEKLKRSYSWVMLYLPRDFKDKEMAELGKKGGEAKAAAAATRLVPTETELAEAERKMLQHQTQCQNPACLRLVPDVEIRVKNDKSYCLKCAPFIKEIKPEVPEEKKPVTAESWEERKKHMQTADPEVDRVLFQRLSGNEELREGGWRVEYHQKHIASYVEDDVYLVNEKLGVSLAVFFDGSVHNAKRKDRDEVNRDKAEQANDGLSVLALPYKSPSDREFGRLEGAVLEKARALSVELEKWKTAGSGEAAEESS